MADLTPEMGVVLSKIGDARKTIYGAFQPDGAVLLLCEAMEAVVREVERLRALVEEGGSRG